MAGVSGPKARYEVFGPYPFNLPAGTSHRRALREFWNERISDGSPEGLEKAVGVYVWTVQRNGKRIPWNVGITSRGFRYRFPEKEASFLKLLLAEKSSPKIEVYLLARRTKAGGFSTTAQRKINGWLETMLIGSAISINPELRNTAKSAYLRKIVVDGYLNDKHEERSSSAKSFSMLFKARRVRN